MEKRHQSAKSPTRSIWASTRALRPMSRSCALCAVPVREAAPSAAAIWPSIGLFLRGGRRFLLELRLADDGAAAERRGFLFENIYI